MKPRPLLVCLLAIIAAGCASGSARTRSSGPSEDVTASDLRNPNETMERALERRVPGLIAKRNSAGELVLLIRGTSSYAGNDSPPLYIVNGLPFQAGPGGGLTGLDVEDIATIKVLKGSEAVIYGIDAADGVIVITTKKGGRR